MKLFKYGGVASVATGILFAINYHTWGKRNEQSVYEKNNLKETRRQKEFNEKSQIEGIERF